MSSQQNGKSNPRRYERSNIGLRDALFDEMEDLRSGVSDPYEALAFAKLAEKVIESVQLDFRRDEIQARREERLIHEREIAIEERKLLAAPVDLTDEEWS